MATTFLVVKNRAVSTLNGGINQSNTIDESGINFENLNANGDVGTGASQVPFSFKEDVFEKWKCASCGYEVKNRE